MDKIACSMPDYEAEYKRLRDEKQQMIEKLSDVECKNKELYEENIKLRAQLDIVHLIFGRGRC